jgi:hypothetical protein
MNPRFLPATELPLDTPLAVAVWNGLATNWDGVRQELVAVLTEEA